MPKKSKIIPGIRICRKMWADYDPEDRAMPVVIYNTRADQRANRPELKPEPVIVVSFATLEALREVARATYNGRTKADGAVRDAMNNLIDTLKRR